MIPWLSVVTFSRQSRGDNPAGIFLKRDPVYAEIRDLTIEEEDLPQGDFKRERKMAEWPRVSELCQQLLAEKSKDLQLAAWLCLAALEQDGLPGLAAGLELIESLLRNVLDLALPAPG